MDTGKVIPDVIRVSSICFTWARQFGEVRRDNCDCCCFVFIQVTETRLSLCVWRVGQFRVSSMTYTEDVWFDPTPCSPRDLLKAVTPLMYVDPKLNWHYATFLLLPYIGLGPFRALSVQSMLVRLGGALCALLKQLI